MGDGRVPLGGCLPDLVGLRTLRGGDVMEEGERRYIVLRKCPRGVERGEGQWYSVPGVIEELNVAHDARGTAITFQPTGRFETREDGVQAEVYEPVQDDEATPLS